MQTSLIINSTDTNGVAKSKAISNINPEATGEQLGEFAQRLTALTTNQYTGANVISKCDVTEYSSGGSSSSSTGLLNPNLRLVNDVTTWEGNGTCTAYYWDDDQMVAEFMEKNEGIYTGQQRIFLLTSDGTYAKDWHMVVTSPAPPA